MGKALAETLPIPLEKRVLESHRGTENTGYGDWGLGS